MRVLKKGRNQWALRCLSCSSAQHYLMPANLQTASVHATCCPASKNMVAHNHAVCQHSQPQKQLLSITLMAGMGVGKCILARTSYRCFSTVDLGTRICISLTIEGTTLAKMVDMVFSICCSVPSMCDCLSCLSAPSSDAR